MQEIDHIENNPSIESGQSVLLETDIPEETKDEKPNEDQTNIQ